MSGGVQGVLVVGEVCSYSDKLSRFARLSVGLLAAAAGRLEPKAVSSTFSTAKKIDPEKGGAEGRIGLILAPSPPTNAGVAPRVRVGHGLLVQVASTAGWRWRQGVVLRWSVCASLGWDYASEVRHVRIQRIVASSALLSPLGSGMAIAGAWHFHM